ncbi:Malectin-like domain [Dillenia turbinata]|uniref:Malectin-like domain n=1 Tax=Dillenia turbinata TaxID=194707 RepID=A0AAN8V8I2_9MAGN
MALKSISSSYISNRTTHLMSLDCGSSDLTYTDDNNIVWTGDDSFIGNGESEVVANTNNVSHVMSTLRVFTSRKKNCYSIPADQGNKVLVRASFYYGNYDKKSSPPTFDLLFDGNLWATVVTSIDQVIYYEVIYVVKGDAISVCVAQTMPNQYPFMSALEVRGIESDMYKYVDSNYALFSRRRVAYGANDTIRYSDDPYDRIWSPAIVSNGLIAVPGTDPTFIDNTGSANLPPPAVLANAVTTTSTSTSILIGTNLPTTPVPIYISMYFSEVTQLDSTQTRSFELYIDNKANSDPIIPPYDGVIELVTYNTTATSNTSFSLVATSSSTLPPIINALEVYAVSESPLTDGTNNKDVNGLSALQTAFSVLKEWSGDPCLPAPYTWDWVNCSSDATPRVTALYGLSSYLPDFSSMDALQTIDMHNNSIVGSIPDFLGTLPNLRQLNLANNELSGTIPTSISKNNNLKLTISGNPNLCTSTSSKSCGATTTTSTTSSSSGSPSGGAKTSKLPVILGVTIPVFVLFWALVGLMVILQQRRKRASLMAIGTGKFI